jgi:NRPS condensation-like uncharacterized protein
MTRGAHRASASGPAALPRRPFAIPDELTCYFDAPAEPSNIHLEMLVPGRLDPQAFRAAAIAALAANFRASSRRVPHGPLSRSYAWEHPASLDIDPVSFASFATADELDRLRADFISTSPSIDVAPPARLLLASGPGHDCVMLNAHHAAMDGLSWLELLRAIGRRYRSGIQASAAGEAQPGADPQPAAPPVTSPAAATAGEVDAPGPVPRPRARRPGLPARIAPDGGGQAGYGLRLILLPGVPSAPELSPGSKATLNEALVTALVAAIGRWNAERGRPVRVVRITTPFNARAAGGQRSAGNLSRLVTIAAIPPAPGVGLTPLLQEVARQTRAARSRPGPQVGGGSRSLAVAFLPVTAKRAAIRLALRTAGPLVCDTAMLTNLGNVPDPPDFGQPGPITMAFTAQAQMPRGLTVGVITAGGQLQLAVRYNRALFGEAAAEQFGTALMRALDEVTSTAPDHAGVTASQV